MDVTSITDFDVSSSIELGRGATSVVWLATARAADRGEPSSASVGPPSSPPPPRHYALKAVEKAKIVGQAQLDRLYREKDLLRALQHASVVDFYTTLQDETHLYFVLELLSGGELLWHMRRCPQRRVPPARNCKGSVVQFQLELEAAGDQRVCGDQSHLSRALRPLW